MRCKYVTYGKGSARTLRYVTMGGALKYRNELRNSCIPPILYVVSVSNESVTGFLFNISC